MEAQIDIPEIIHEFFRIYEKSPLEAVDYIFGTNEWMINRNRDGIENVKTQLGTFIQLIGDYCGHEQLTQKNVGKNYCYLSYMVKYDRQPVLFTFVFYRPIDRWKIQHFKFDDDLNEEF